MSKLLQSVFLLGLWAVQGSNGYLVSEPTQGSKVGEHDRPPEPTRMEDIPDLKYMDKRQGTSQSESDLVVTIASDETCGFLSARPALPITCENTRPCMWASEIGIICGDIKDKVENWQIHLRCMDREMALNPSFCNDTCINNPLTLLCTEESAPYCATYVYPDAIRDYRCSKTPASRASSVALTYSGQNNVEFITTHILLNGSKISSTKTTASSSSTTSTTSTIPTSTSASPSPSSSQNNLGAIIGGAIGGFAAVSLVILAIVWFIRQSRKKKDRPPTESSPMEQAPLSDPNAIKPDGRSPVPSDWRSSTMTALSSPNSTSPQAWLDQPVSPSARSDTSQGILPHMGQQLAYEMSGESVPPRPPARRESRVYEMEGDPNHPWV